MSKISRGEFIKTSSLALAAALAPNSLYSNKNYQNTQEDENLMNRLVKGNDKSVERYLHNINEKRQRQYYRNLSGPFASLSAAYCHPKSFYYKSKIVLSGLDQIINELLKLQYPNGTLDAGGNRQSPPDTAFLLNSLCPAANILNKNDFQELAGVKNNLKTFLLNAGEGIRKGGVHTMRGQSRRTAGTPLVLPGMLPLCAANGGRFKIPTGRYRHHGVLHGHSKYRPPISAIL